MQSQNNDTRKVFQKTAKYYLHRNTFFIVNKKKSFVISFPFSILRKQMLNRARNYFTGATFCFKCDFKCEILGNIL